MDREIRVPTITDAMSWFQKSEQERHNELESLLPALQGGGFILPIGNFQETWEFSKALSKLDRSLAQKIHWPKEYLGPTIPEAFREILAQKEGLGSLLIPWERVEQEAFEGLPIALQPLTPARRLVEASP